MNKTTKLLNKITELSLREGTSIIEKALKTSEETGELAQAVLSWRGVVGSAYKGSTSMDVLEEASDTILCAMSVAIAAGYSTEDIEDMMVVKCAKWESKLVKGGKA